jgi:hypothetical protein
MQAGSTISERPAEPLTVTRLLELAELAGDLARSTGWCMGLSNRHLDDAVIHEMTVSALIDLLAEEP